MGFQLTLIVILLSIQPCTGQFHSRDCERRSMCFGVRRYGDFRCYSHGEIMRYPRFCSKFRCRRIGGLYMPVVEKIGCTYNGTCYENGDTVFQERGNKCYLMTCVISGVMWKFREVRVLCKE